MLAKYKGTCSSCGKPINVGEEISWARRGPERGRAYHIACKSEATLETSPLTKETHPVTPKAIPTPVAPAIPALDLNQITQALAALLQQQKAVVVDTPVEEIPTFDVTPPIKPAIKPVHLASNAAWYEVLEAILPVSNRILLVGPPSSGKSTTAMLSANTKHRLTMTETTSREDLIGMFHLIDGETRWIDGPITTAMREGEAVLIDEIDRYSAECASLLYSVIDDKSHISLPTGELVEASEGYKVIMTTNETVETLPPAVQDRIEVIIMASTPHQDAIADMPKAMQNVIMRYYNFLPVPALRLLPTVRRMRMFHRLVTANVPNQIAAKLVFGANGSAEVLSAITSAESNPV